MSIQLAVAPIAWSNSDLPELGGETSLETCLRESREAGFTGTETGVKYPLDAEILGPLLETHGLQLASGWFSGTLRECSVEQEFENLRQMLTTFKALNAPVVIYAETSGSVQSQQNIPVSQKPVMLDAEFPEYGRKLTEVADRMADFGVRMSYHHHMGTVIETEREIDLLMENTGTSVGLLIDTGHLGFTNADTEAVTRRYGSRINHVHCKDIRQEIFKQVREKDLSFLDAVLEGVFTVPGDGFIDFENFAKVLAEIDYSGWVVVEAEQDPEKANPLEYSRMGYQHLSNVLHEAGLEISS
jgi:inosose dehydratase